MHERNKENSKLIYFVTSTPSCECQLDFPKTGGRMGGGGLGHTNYWTYLVEWEPNHTNNFETYIIYVQKESTILIIVLYNMHYNFYCPILAYI